MIGLFIGSFNPPTLAHLNICLELEKNFKKIIFIPINMLKIYCKKFSFLDIDDIMNKYSYFDYHILDLLKKKYCDVKIIIGSDILNNFDKFDNKEYLLNNYYFVVIERNKNEVDIINKKFNEYINHFDIVNFNSNVSSTKARLLIKDKQCTNKVLDKEIYFYIKRNHLYF